jgi:hypothetical protein
VSDVRSYKVIQVKYSTWARLVELKVKLNKRSLNDVIETLLTKCVEE